MVEITTPYVSYATDGAQTSFDITFDYREGDPLEVILAETATQIEQVLISGTHYVIEGSAELGWTLVTIATYALGFELFIIRESEQVQHSDYIENYPIPVERLENDYDKIVRMVQELQRSIDRALKLRQTTSVGDVEMADPSDGSILKFSSATDRYEVVKGIDLVGLTIVAFMEDFLESADVEEARTHLGGDADWREVDDIGEPAFENSWVNSGGSYATMAFRMDSSGYVHLKGRVQGGTPSTTIFTLPVGYRPSKDQLFTVPYSGNDHNIKVQSDGQVIDQGSVIPEPSRIIDESGNTYVDTAGSRVTIRAQNANKAIFYASQILFTDSIELQKSAAITSVIINAVAGQFPTVDFEVSGVRKWQLYNNTTGADEFRLVPTSGSGLEVTQDGALSIPRQPSGRIYLDTAQNATASSTTKIELDGEDFLYGGVVHDAVTDFDLTVPVDGVYRIEGCMNFVSSTSANLPHYLQIRVNAVSDGYFRQLTGNAANNGMRGSVLVELSANDYVDLRVYIGSGSDKAIRTARHATFLSLIKVA